MISLIVNADDLGLNPDRDRGIIEAYKFGVVTSSTVIANGPSFESACKFALEAGIPTGIHLNLSEGTTLSGPIKGLTDLQNKLPGKAALRNYLLGKNQDLDGIRREFSAQIEKVLSAGLKPGHIDGHQHCHAYPHITEITVKLGHEYNLHAMRTIRPEEFTSFVTPDDLKEEMALFRGLGQKAHDIIQAAGLSTTFGLCGLPQLHSLNTTSLCDILNELPEGVWELMTHPGYPNPNGKPFESEQRLIELRALCSGEAKDIVKRRRISLCTFGDLPCAS